MQTFTLTELTRWIKQQHQECQSFPTTTLPRARNLGEGLLVAKQVLSGSDWVQWVIQDCQLSEAGAEMYMAIAQGWQRLGDPIKIVFAEPCLAVLTNNLVSSPEPEFTASVTTPEPEFISSATTPEPEFISSATTPEPEFISSVTTPEPEFTPSATTPEPTPVASPQQVLTLFIPGSVVPKARPRVTSNGTYLPKRYREWRNRAEGEILLQLARMETTWALPFEKAAIQVRLIGKHRLNADADNIVGSCLDALVAVGVLKNDSLTYVPEIDFKLIPKGSCGVEIRVIPRQ